MLNQQLDRAFQALGDPTRRLMLERLARAPASVSALAETLPISLPGVMQHLKVLEDSGLIRTRKQGRVRTCELEPQTFNAARAWLDEQRALWEARFDRFDAFVLEQDKKETPDE